MKNIILILCLLGQALWLQAQTLELKQWHMINTLDVSDPDAQVSTVAYGVDQ
ncbi:secreted protein, partial [gut metagenome]